MKNLIIILTFFFLTFTLISQAQETKSPIKIGSVKTYSTWGISEINSNPKEVNFTNNLIDPIPIGYNYSVLTSMIFQNRNFHANPTAGTPNDNAIAISSNTLADTIVSMSNHALYLYLPDGTLLNMIPLDSFIWKSGNIPMAVAGDPKVIWDIHENRFVACFMSWGSSTGAQYPDKSELYVIVSKTSNPADGFYISRTIDSNIVASNFWLDRPQLALSNQEVLASCQVSKDGSGISKSNTIIGIEKNMFYAGISSQVFHLNDIHTATDTPVVLTPARGEHSNYGPGLYFVSNPKYDFGIAHDTLYYIDLQDDLHNGGTAMINPMQIAPFYQAHASKQPNGQNIGSNDARILEALYYNGKIKSVFVGKDFNHKNESLSGLKIQNFNILNNSKKQGYFFQFDKYLCYPSIASFAITGNNSEEVVVSYLKASPTIYPSFYATIFDSSLLLPNMGNELLIKAGTTNKSSYSWGDYTGICRKHDASFPTVWTIGSYTTNSNNDSVWVAEITNQESTSIISVKKNKNGITIFPNPTSSQLNISVPENIIRGILKIFNLHGQVILEKSDIDFQKSTTTKLDISQLPEGNYVLYIESQKKSYHGKFQVLH